MEFVQFDDAQRERIHTVAAVVRGTPAAFTDAGRWLDGGPNAKRARDVLVRAVHRHHSAHIPDRPTFESALSRWAHHEATPEEVLATIWKADDVKPDDYATIIADLLATRETLDGNYAHTEAMMGACDTLIVRKLNFDAMDAATATTWATRLLLYIWLLTDVQDLRLVSHITNLQKMEWGAAFLFPANNRLSLRYHLFEKRVQDWLMLTKGALLALQMHAPYMLPAEKGVAPRECSVPMHMTEIGKAICETAETAKESLTKLGALIPTGIGKGQMERFVVNLDRLRGVHDSWITSLRKWERKPRKRRKS